MSENLEAEKVHGGSTTQTSRLLGGNRVHHYACSNDVLLKLSTVDGALELPVVMQETGAD